MEELNFKKCEKITNSIVLALVLLISQQDCEFEGLLNQTYNESNLAENIVSYDL